MCGACNTCYRKVETFLTKCFAKYGRLVARYPWFFIICSAVVCACLGIGLIRLTPEIDIEVAYTPRGSEASDDRSYIYNTYPDVTVSNFSVQTLPNLGLFADIVMKPKDGSDGLLPANLDTLESIYQRVINITVQSGGTSLNYDDLCARTYAGCAVTGSFVFTSTFKSDVSSNAVDYPFYGTEFLPFVLGDVTTSAGKVTGAKYVRIRLNLRQDSGYAETSQNWLQAFKTHMDGITSNTLDLAYSHSDSMEEELDKNAKGDIIYMSLTFTFMITYAIFAISGGNCVSNRGFLANAGVLATGLAILGAMGLMSACGVKFVSIVGVMPFLVLGIGVDDMFILLSGLAEVQHLATVEERISETMRSAGLAITITSVTDLLAFGVGSISGFLSVQNFCIYTGVAVVFCYINQVTFFTGCMTLHERRVLSFRHGVTCMKLQSKDEMVKSGKSKLSIICCSGSQPKSRDEVEGILEKYPRKLLSFVLKFPLVRIMTLFVFGVYLGVVIWGATQVEEGLVLKDTVSTESYYYKCETFLSHLTSDHFVSLIFKGGVKYWDTSVRSQIERLILSAQALPSVSSNFSLSWIRDFESSPIFDSSSESAFVSALQTFLSASPSYVNDVVIRSNTIVSSRVHLLTQNIHTTNAQADLMTDLREVAINAPMSVIAYAPPFIFYEQYTAILPSTLQTVGIALIAVVVATFLFMPHVIMMFYVVVTLVMIVVGVFASMYFWGITLSSITMILLIMSVGFAIDYSIHTSHAFIQADRPSRLEKMTVAINMAAAPIVNAALSSFVGILMLIFANSYIFQTFFKIMFLVIVLGFVHSTFFLPSLLSFIGPMGLIKSDSQKDDENIPRPGRQSRARVSPLQSPKHRTPSPLSLNTIQGGTFRIPRPKIIT